MLVVSMLVHCWFVWGGGVFSCILTFISLEVIWPFHCGVVLYGVW